MCLRRHCRLIRSPRARRVVSGLLRRLRRIDLRIGDGGIGGRRIVFAVAALWKVCRGSEPHFYLTHERSGEMFNAFTCSLTSVFTSSSEHLMLAVVEFRKQPRLAAADGKSRDLEIGSRTRLLLTTNQLTHVLSRAPSSILPIQEPNYASLQYHEHPQSCQSTRRSRSACKLVATLTPHWPPACRAGPRSKQRACQADTPKQRLRIHINKHRAAASACVSAPLPRHDNTPALSHNIHHLTPHHPPTAAASTHHPPRPQLPIAAWLQRCPFYAGHLFRRPVSYIAC